MSALDAPALSRGWFGYGRWGAPYWFVGMEPGGSEAGDDLAIWEQAGRPEFTDITLCHPDRPAPWFGPDAKTQPTWAKLIWLLLAYRGIEPTRDATLEYQRAQLGRPTGETTLIELSPFAAANLSVDSPRTLGRYERIETVRTRLLECKPKFVVFYSTNRPYGSAWTTIAGVPLVEGRPALVGATACVMTFHPGFKRDKAYWIEIGRRLRETCHSQDA